MITLNGQKLTCTQMREMEICTGCIGCKSCIAFISPKERLIDAGKQFLTSVKQNLLLVLN